MPGVPGDDTGSVWSLIGPEPAEDSIVDRPLESRHLRDLDVAIVGAGFTGLWTAWHLLARRPGLKVAVLEAFTVGYGASGRNGGWCSAALPISLDRVARTLGVEATHVLQQRMIDTVTDIGRWCETEGVDADFAPGGWVQLARNPAQAARLADEVAMYRRFGFAEATVRLDDAATTATRVRATRVEASTYATHTAALHPLKLVRGLARAVRSRGGLILEHLPVQEITPQGCVTSKGTITAPWVIRATEGYTASLRNARRDLAPVHSLMIGTETLAPDIWDEIGLRDREVVNDARRLVIYAQRTGDDRLVFGGRGAPYHWGSRTSTRYDTDIRIRSRLVTAARELWPVLERVDFPYHWGGPLGVARDMSPHLVVDARTRRAWAGGYLGDGVASSALAGRALAEHILGESDPAAPARGSGPRRWEREPWRWMGINAMLSVVSWADRYENRTRRQAPVVDRLLP